jgi:dTDP-D-glucose 4,6-dehydratase
MAAAGAGRPKWLIAGGCGVVGRNFVKYLLDNNLAADLRVVDKKLPFMSFMK